MDIDNNKNANIDMLDIDKINNEAKYFYSFTIDFDIENTNLKSIL